MKPWRRRVHGKTPPSPALPHGTAINQNKPTQNQTPVTTTAKRRQQPVGETLVRPWLDNRLGASREHTLACLDTRFAGHTESGGYWIPGPASRHKQIFQASSLLAIQQVVTQYRFHLLRPSGTKQFIKSQLKTGSFT